MKVLERALLCTTDMYASPVTLIPVQVRARREIMKWVMVTLISRLFSELQHKQPLRIPKLKSHKQHVATLKG